MGASCVEAEPAVVGLRQDGVGGFEDELGEEDGIVAFVDLMDTVSVW